ncbi:MAG TPA: hypothetical protein VNS55_15735 [Nocardioides sp.]|nr:hypothetical protein [Nocardioides sp.]
MNLPDDADQPAPPPSPADEAAVRRLLADARETEPVPPSVAARLDETLAGLVAERSETPEVVALASRRRRRAGALLVAAAAVVVGGLVVGRYAAEDGSSADQASSDSAVARDQPEAAAEGPASTRSGKNDMSTSDSADALDNSLEGNIAEDYAFRTRAPAHLRPDHLMADVVALRRTWPRDVDPDAYAATAPVLPSGFPCASAPWGHGILLGVHYGARPAVVAYRAPQGDTQVVEVLQCGTADVLRSTTIPVR